MPGPVLIAPDKFKGTLTAPDVAGAIAAGLREERPDVEVRLAPVADGGDGTVDAALAAGYSRMTVPVSGPTGYPVDTEIAYDGETAVVELASASGLALLDPDDLDALGASSDGTGEALLAALSTGARRIVLGVGGSACTDGGAGLLTVLGARVLDVNGNPVAPGGGPLANVGEVDLSGLDPRIAEVEVVLASDVDNPLTGPHGAARVYGPQKGANPEQVELLDSALARYAQAVVAAGGLDVADQPGSGAAGGVGFAALAALGATMRPGVDVVLDLVDFDRRLDGAGLVITGEGALDEQTLHGKAPAGVAARAIEAGIPVVAVAGRCDLTGERLAEAGIDAAYALLDVEPDPQRCMADPAPLLTRLGRTLAQKHL
ncbi:glycerate kinase [Saccharopolyspora rhizosphaerae]|uniref:Glycerate kinase n=1 Tax=Saccharopolyspora rhizosphaerae TaxID=2492662 RepID=A0A426JI82_9PSEU|nr:glycerate kinase [Saccharopolyspora rhizosphaerae]RRO12898.1 glycerate kinase [Saccharopolyspora rhizosphaerae]